MRLLIPLILALLVVSACATSAPTADELVIVTSIHPLAEFATAVAGDQASVTPLLPAGAEPHTWQPSANDIILMEQADLILLVGAEFEPWAEDMLESLSSQPQVLYLADDAELIENEDDEHEEGHDEDGDEHEEEGEHADEDNHGDAGHAFEWAGLFALDAGDYTWTFAKVDGEYADPAMKMVILETDDTDAHGIEHVEETAEELLTDSSAEEKTPGSALVPGDMAYHLSFDENVDISSFTVRIEQKGNYVFFTEHMPFEFEADEHFFKDASGTNVEPLAEEPETGHDHGHGDHDEENGHDDHHHAIDPHVWLDFAADARFLDTLVATLSEADPSMATRYEQNAAAYAQKLALLDQSYTARLEGCDDEIVVNHDAFGYLARNYGFEQHAIFGISPEDEPTPQELAELVEEIREEGIAVVYAEELVSPKVAETLADEAGAKVLLLNPTPVLTQEQIDKGMTFIDVMYENLDALEEGLCA